MNLCMTDYHESPKVGGQPMVELGGGAVLW